MKAWIQAEDCRADIPASPHRPTRTRAGWAGAIGSAPYGANQNGRFLPFEKARAYARALGLKAANDWKASANKPGRPYNIPTDPDRSLRRAGWVGWGDWLGTGSWAPKTTLPAVRGRPRRWARARLEEQGA